MESGGKRIAHRAPQEGSMQHMSEKEQGGHPWWLEWSHPGWRGAGGRGLRGSHQRSDCVMWALGGHVRTLAFTVRLETSGEFLYL